MKGNLVKNMVMLTGMTVGLGSCYNDTYDYSGFIGNEHVDVRKTGWGLSFGRVVEVKRNDSLVIKFYSTGNSLNSDTNLLEIDVVTNNGTKYYDDDEIGALVMKEGRKQHQEYLKAVLENKKAEGLNYLKK